MILALVFTWILLIINLTQSSSTDLCPVPENLTPCTCSVANKELLVHCVNVRSLKSLERSMKSLRGTHVYFLAIEDSEFDYLPSNIFEDISIRNIIISRSKFSRIGNLGEEQFYGLQNSLESLKLEYSFTKSQPLPFLFLSHLKKLHTFEVRNSFCGIVHILWFVDGPTSLREVKFVDAGILNVQYKAFEALAELRILDLSENEIVYLTRSMMPDPALHLEELNLERNELNTISEGFFNRMPQLKRVNLDLNQFSTIDEKVWSPIWNNLKFLNLIDNPIICDKNLLWLLQQSAELEDKLTGTCYKPFNLMEREIHSLQPKELL